MTRFNRNVLDHWIANKEIKFTAKTVDEDPASYKRWISRKEIQSPKILRTKNQKSKDYCKAGQNNVYCFFIAIFRLAILAFFRLTDVNVKKAGMASRNIVTKNIRLLHSSFEIMNDH